MIKLKAFGDICPGDKYIPGLGVLSKSKKFGSDFPFSEVKEYLLGADIVCGNFEGLLSARAIEKNGSELTFCGLPAFARDMFNCGINVLNVANNHSLEHGQEIFLESVEWLKAAGLMICGLRSKSDKYYSDPVIFSVKGQRFGILGYNWVGVDNFKDSDKYIAQSRASLVNYTWDRENFVRPHIELANAVVINDIRTLRAEVDVLIVMTHWGYEYVTIPPYNLTLEAHALVEAGADIIIGGHPHVLQGMETYKSGLIFYSLGNFIFDFHEKLPRCTTVLDITIEEDKDFSFKFNPLYINNYFQPRKVTPEEYDYILCIIQKSNEALSSADKMVMLDDESLYRQHEEFYNKSKIIKIFSYVYASIRNPSLVLIILKKSVLFAKILWMRLNGRRVRW